jgi:hypothetical protein
MDILARGRVFEFAQTQATGVPARETPIIQHQIAIGLSSQPLTQSQAGREEHLQALQQSPVNALMGIGTPLSHLQAASGIGGLHRFHHRLRERW